MTSTDPEKARWLCLAKGVAQFPRRGGSKTPFMWLYLTVVFNFSEDSGSLQVEVIRHGNTITSTVPPQARAFPLNPLYTLGLEQYVSKEDDSGRLFFSLLFGNILYYIKPETQNIEVIQLPENRVISLLDIDDEGSIFVLCESTDRDSWQIFYMSYDAETNILKTIQTINADLLPTFNLDNIGIVSNKLLSGFGSVQSVINNQLYTSYASSDFYYIDINKGKIISFQTLGKWFSFVKYDPKRKELTLTSQHPKYKSVLLLNTYSFNEHNEMYIVNSFPAEKITPNKLAMAAESENYLYFVTDGSFVVAPYRSVLSNILRVKSVDPVPGEEDIRYINRHRIHNYENTAYISSILLEDNQPTIHIYRYHDKKIEMLFRKKQSTGAYSPHEMPLSYIIMPFMDYDNNSLYFKMDGYWHKYSFDKKVLHSTDLPENYYAISSKGSHTLFVCLYTARIKYLDKKKDLLVEQLTIENLFRNAEEEGGHNYLDYFSTYEHINSLSPMLIEKSIYSDSSNSLYINSNTIISNELTGYLEYSYHINEYIDSVSIGVSQEGITVKFPTHRVDLQTGEIDFLANWLTIFKSRDNHMYTLYMNRKEEEKFLTIRKIVNGKAVSNSDDPEISWSDYTRFGLLQREIDGHIALILDQTIYYRCDEKWHTLNIGDLSEYGIREISSLNNGIVLNEVIYLAFNSVILKILRDGTKLLYTEKEGMPRGNIHLDRVDDNILVNSAESIYLFEDINSDIKVVNNFFHAGERIYSTDHSPRLKHNVGAISFPVSIINTLYPEKSFLEYQLKGFQKKAVKIPYVKEIRFEKLLPGRYTFILDVTTETGETISTSPVKFSIAPPIYATWWAYIIYLLIIAGTLRTAYRVRTKQLKQRNLQLEETVEERTAEIHKRQQRLQESIDYASLIQRSILPQSNDMTQAFGEHFVLWKPRDKVGGDFYWLHEIPQTGEVLFAVIDCTGHGVPGSLLSMSVNQLLNYIVRDRNASNPAEILKHIHQEIGYTLHQESDETRQDGLEISLIRLNKEKQTLVFSGAGQHLIYYDGLEPDLKHIRGFKHGVGGLKWRKDVDFKEVELVYSSKAVIYLYTDGIIDQPMADRERRKRFGHPEWLKLLSNICVQPISLQEEIIEAKLQEMLSIHEQRDDITVIGIIV
jgi:serine phosphatase RsbU (regulator of sigma subunit)